MSSSDESAKFRAPEESGQQALAEALALDPNHLLEHDIKNVFNQLDVDQNGFLGAPDLVKCFRSLGENLDDSIIDSMLSQIDKDGDGQISYSEFWTLVKSLEAERGGLRPKGYEAKLEVATHKASKLSKQQTGSSDASLGTWAQTAKESAQSSSSSSA